MRAELSYVQGQHVELPAAKTNGVILRFYDKPSSPKVLSFFYAASIVTATALHGSRTVSLRTFSANPLLTVADR